MAVGNDEDDVAGFGLGLRKETACEQHGTERKDCREDEGGSVHDGSLILWFKRVACTSAPDRGAASVC